MQWAKTVATLWENLLTRCFVDFLSSMRLVWSKSEQSKQSLASRGLQRCVLSLSTGRCTVDVGKRAGRVFMQGASRRRLACRTSHEEGGRY